MKIVKSPLLRSLSFFISFFVSQWTEAGTTIDLKQFGAYSRGKFAIHKQFDPGLTEKGIYFIDGASATDDSTIYDLARLNWVVQSKLIQAIKGFEKSEIAYSVGLNGSDHFLLLHFDATRSSVGYSAYSFNSGLSTDLSDTAIKGKLNELQIRYPQLEFHFLSSLRILNVSCKVQGCIEVLLAIERFSLDAEVKWMEPDYEAYPAPWIFGEAKMLGYGENEEIVDLSTFRTVTAELLKDGRVLSIPPHLPFPFSLSFK